MDATTKPLIESLHRASCKYVLALTGGGTGVAAQLLSVPGGSRTILEIIVPYAEQALADFLGRAPENYCSAATSRRLARRARERAAWLAPGEPVLGVGCTASLATDRPKRGDHRFHIAVHTGQGTATYSLTLSKGSRDREGEESVLDAVLLNALADHLGVAERLPVPLLPGEIIEAEPPTDGGPLAALLRGEVQAVCSDIDSRLRTDAPRPPLLLPGSFNPLHEGHCDLAATASQMLGQPVAFELTVANADKPPLSLEAVEHRRRQFLWQAPLWLTNAPTFAAKAELFPGTTFIVGADTAVRIVDPRFYQDSIEKMTAALRQLRERDCRFLVAGRLDKDGRFTCCEHLELPEEFRDLFTGITFRRDVSSTQLREQSPPL